EGEEEGGFSGLGIQFGALDPNDARTFIALEEAPQSCKPGTVNTNTGACELEDDTPCALDEDGRPSGDGPLTCKAFGQAYADGTFMYPGYFTDLGDSDSGGGDVVPGAIGNFTNLLRANDSLPQDFNAINTAAGEDYEVYRVTQGLLFGFPQ
ncbi:MAG: hypothetical protein P8J42_05250, partial [Pseudomonadales bacterium]|nr:hypothetical protein [Pseudomonadales bacterium]